MIKNAPKIAAVATAIPEFRPTQDEAAGYILDRFSAQLGRKGRLALKRIFGHPSIRTRHFAIDDPASFFNEGPDARIARFTEKALELSCRALEAVLAKAGINAGELDALIVNTCTGYICPGLSTYLIERLGMPRGIKAFDLVGAGCSGALPNMEMAAMVINSNPGGIAACVSVEICSATFEMGGADDYGLIISNALFSDGAAAAVIWGRPQGLEVVSSKARYVPELRESIRFVHKNGRLTNQISMGLPGLVGQHVKGVVMDAIAASDIGGNGSGIGGIGHWAIHAGGEKIIDAVRDALGIPEEKTGPARKILSEHGNMSSATVWFVLEKIINSGVQAGQYCVMASFGAGLSAHCAILRQR